MSTRNRVAIVIGASRGIGAFIAQRLSTDGYTVVVAARRLGNSTQATNVDFCAPTCTLQNVADEIKRRGGVASAVECDVADPTAIERLFEQALKTWGRVDAVVFNAGAIWWGPVKDTDYKRYSLLTTVNQNALYKTVQVALPLFSKQKHGRILVVSPPIYSRFFRGKTAYAMSKVAMTVLTHGLAMELEEFNSKNGLPDSQGLAITSLWPATAVESAVTHVKQINPEFLRKPTIFADAVSGILNEPSSKVNGGALIDEDYLREHKGITDFSHYQVVPGKEPARMMPRKFPSLLVEEQDDRGFAVAEGKSKPKL